MIFSPDTNAIIHLIINKPAVTAQYEKCLADGAKIVLSPYVDFEVRRGLKYKKATAKERIYERLSHKWRLGEMTRTMWLRAALLYSDLRHSGFTVSDADILIAAFCIENGCTLVTNNRKDFRNIDGIKMVDWTEKPTGYNP